jgi:hypothetical protein
MKTLHVYIGKLFVPSLFALVLPLAAAAKTASKKKNHFHFAARVTERRYIALEAAGLYYEMDLQDSGLNEKALEYALLGYHHLLKKHALHKSSVLSVCDFSQPSSAKRMYILDLQNRRLLYRTYVAHGQGSGRQFANRFSNVPESYKSSLGFYVTGDTYVGSNGLSLRIDGVEKGFNDKAHARSIVIHGANYVSERVLHKYGLMGTTFGCPAVPEDMAPQIIPVLKNGTCFFIYYPSKRYLSSSKMING